MLHVDIFNYKITLKTNALCIVKGNNDMAMVLQKFLKLQFYCSYRETVTSIWIIAHDWCQVCAQCLLGEGKIMQDTLQ